MKDPNVQKGVRDVEGNERALPPVSIHPLWTEDHPWYPRAKEIGWALQYSPELVKRGLLGISYMSTFEQC